MNIRRRTCRARNLKRATMTDSRHSLNLAVFSSRTNYNYDSLPAGWTRILELHPHPGTDGHLSCSLMSRKIGDIALKYEALSYVWGSDAVKNEVNIECDGSNLSVGLNLARALMRIRLESESRLLWVDAICINQKDDDERSRQVQCMGDIYANASRVLVWIGESVRNEAAECFDLIRKTNIVLDNLYLQYQAVEEIPPIQCQEILDANPADWDMVRRFMESPWFTRVWVLQEVGLARSATIYYGRASLEWSQLVEFMLFVASRADVGTHVGNVKSGTIWDVFEDIWCSFGNETSWRNELPLTRSLNRVGSVQSFVNILAVTRPYHATNQRDHVYAFLGHPTATGGTANKGSIVTVDYKKSTDDVYLATATRLLKTDENPWTVLSCVDHKPDSPSLSGQRPSWVPRWDEDWYTYWLGYPSMWYRAGGNTPARFNATISDNGAVLLIQGIILDTVTWHSPAFEDEELKPENQLTKAPVQELWRQLQQLLEQSPRYEDPEYAFSLAIAAGRAADEGPAEDNPETHQSVYAEYKKLINWDQHGEEASRMKKKRPEMSSKSSETSLQIDARMYVANQRRAMHNRRFFLTSTGYMGIGHRALGVGDTCVVVKGANVPFILRKGGGGEDKKEMNQKTSPKPHPWRLISESYIQGIMRGTTTITTTNDSERSDDSDRDRDRDRERDRDADGSSKHDCIEEKLAIE